MSKKARDAGVGRTRDDRVHSLFSEIAARFPTRPCLTMPGPDGTVDHSLTYSQFDALSASIAEVLKCEGVRPGDRVGFLMDRSLIQPAVILAILRAGAAYVPLDPSYPAQRIRLMIQETALRLLVTTQALSPLARSSGQCCLILGPEGALEGRIGEPARVASEEPASPAESTAYIMFTSGSTGRPKGVCIPHRGIVRLVRDSSFTPLGPDRVFLQLAPVSFDAHTLELWGPLLNGGLCVLYPGPSLPDPELLSKIITRQGVTTLWLTASLFNILIQESPSSLLGVQEILVGGEALSIPHIRRAQELLPGVQLVNGYGPTENTTFTTCCRIPSPLPGDWTSIPIGRPIEKTQVYILDDRKQPVADGEPGELYIGGEGLATGYFGRPELNAEKFVPDCFSKNGSARLYRTGDRVRLMDSGLIEFLGREDEQVKLNGNRIELGEIKTAILEHDAVLEALATVVEVAGERRLVAYFTLKDPSLPAPDLDALLRRSLPPAMVPAFLVALEKFPITANGKIDRHSLPPPRLHESEQQAEAPAGARGADADHVEEAIAAVWSDLLALAHIPPTVPFFEMGGTSLLALTMQARIKSRLGLSIPIAEIFRHSTVRSLAAFLAGVPDREDQPHSPPPGIQAADDNEGIAIIGMAGRFPGAGNIEEFWELLLEGRASLTAFQRSDLDPSLSPGLVDDPDYVMSRGVLENVDLFDAEYFGILPREAEVMDPQQRIFMEVVVEALENAGCDQRRFPGAIGLFAGSGNTSYWHNHLLPRPEIIEGAGATAVRVGNEKDFLVTRVAHALGLKGPAVAINTACSTSLVATAQAFHSLRSGECDIAVAGGVTILCPPNSGGLYEEGSMLSPDGYTRTFDAKAQGTSFNDGAAALVLRKLSSALREGDQIFAVIKGVGLNNDGSDKMSFVAPGVSGQAAAIRRALAMAGLSPEKISYVEAHGTATPIGDPIEVAALSLAFRASTQEKGFCALGSVKSNIGHIISAAGAAGLIKTSLALKHRILPGTAHFTAPNPQLQLEDSPFWVVAATQPWKRGDEPLRAGVSAFGWGGTNAHVILEEAPEGAPSEPEGGPQLLVLSAAQPAALEQACSNLAQHLVLHPEQPLSDLAFTLQTGRSLLVHRTFVCADSVESAITGLGTAAARARPREDRPRLAFLFPGQGSQYTGMGMELYESSAIYREAFRECAQNAFPVLGEELLDVVSACPEKLSRTKYTQIALFTVMYALARHWESLGIRPQTALGHSVGEFVAACLAGVMEPADAARLVALRGQFVDACPPGGMLAVRLGPEELQEILPPALEIAAWNAPRSQVISGPLSEIEAFEKELEKRSVPCRSLTTSHAFHSRMMEEAVAKFQEEVARVSLSPPRFPFLSTLTGTWIRSEEATDPAYWARHLRHPVRFSQAVDTLLAEKDWICLEVGPGSVLSKLVLQNPRAKGRTAVASLSDSQGSELDCMTEALGALWRAGLEPDWKAVHGGRRRQKLSLPSYPFQRKRYWIDTLPYRGQGTPLPAPLDADAALQEREVLPIMEESRKPRILSALYEVLEALSGLKFLPEDSTSAFAELGLDSLQLTQAALKASKAFALKLKLRHFVEEFPSPATLVDYLDSALPAQSFASAATAVAAVAAPSAALASLAFPPLPPPAFAAPGSQPALEALIGQQMELMQQQLALLSGSASAPKAAASLQNATAAVAEEAAAVAEKAAPDLPELPPKPHGPQLVIDRTGKKELSPSQERCRKRILDRYEERTKNSKAFTQRNRSSVADPRAVAGFKPQMKEMIYPIVVERSQGCRLWDIDGNRYVDLLSGYGSNFFGFGSAFVKAALCKQMDAGMEIGPQSPLIEKLATLFRQFVPMDRIAFCNTGSEAVLAALRMARTATGKDLVVMFHGSYHGIFDEVVVRTGAGGKSIPAAPGIPGQSVENVLLLDWASEASLEVIRSRAGEIAAVITEPVQSRAPEIQPAEFLKKLRRITQEGDIALIFDEVVTGFRIGPGGAQEYFGIEADLATYGKVIGGGISIGVVAGKRQYMDSLDGGAWQYGDASVPEVGVTYFAGTFVRHPLALAVAVAVLEKLKLEGPELYRDLNEKTEAFASELNDLFESEVAPVRLRHFGSIMKIEASHDLPFYELLFILLRLRGVHCWDGRPCFMTLAHSRGDLDFVVQAFRESIAELQEGGFYPLPSRQAKADRPPVPGARLGRDRGGNPVWYIPDPEDSSKTVELKQEAHYVPSL